MRYANRDIYAGAKSFNIQVFEAAANDDCANAEVITVTTDAATNVQTETGGATQSLIASCEDASATWLDVWYQFTMPVNGNIRITSVDGFDQCTLYANCADTMLATPVEIGCSRDDTYYHDLTMGTTYTLRYANLVSFAGAKNFDIQAFETVANDDCSNAEVIAVTTAAATNVQTETGGANQSLIASCEDANNTWLDVWYQFTMPVNGNIRITSVDVFDQFTLFASCADTMLATPIEIGCSRDDTYYYDLIMGTTYTLRYANLQSFAGVKNFDIQAFEDIVNDDCANAEVIQVANIGLCSTENVTIDSRRASITTNIGSCQNASQIWLDAWYAFEAPLTGNINLNSSSGFNNFVVYDSCGGTEVACFNTSGVIPVVFGQTYLLQVMRTDSAANSFTFCLEGAPEVAPGTVGSCETLPDVTISTSENNLNEWLPIIDANGNIAAAIHANGNDLGVVTTTLFVDAGDTRTTSNGHTYSRREVSISPTTQPTTNVSIRIYSLEDEITDLITADANLNSYFGLEMMRLDGSGCTAGYTAGGDFFNATTVLYGADYYTGFNTNSFSVFYPTSTNLDSTLSIDTISSVQGISVYPTISSGIINIKAEDNLGKTMLSVLDLNGRVILSSEIDLDGNPVQINLESTSKGLYFLKLENNGNIKTQKIILK
ncbi:T9SS type A sorting domain-containing protein [Lacinutrix himadriensis]|uniref:T9SS type A sorting domain-containing protein n=1 Tax=Lacinutrix himadriensis TaxID=641549 RepID=UPI0006E1E7A3|nr:T9SS type A sorting domain-containing protein [Lacinutrix himadriensis]